MAFKTITIDLEAYELLSGERKGDESFSRVIKRRLRAAPTAESLLARLAHVRVPEDALDRTEALIAARKDSVRKPPRL